jgi:CO/xanthine dehydrogenase Mo-binding subunit
MCGCVALLQLVGALRSLPLDESAMVKLAASGRARLVAWSHTLGAAVATAVEQIVERLAMLPAFAVA